MSIKDEIAHYTARVAELERQLDAAPRLSLVKVIAGELMRTRAALEAAKAEPPGGPAAVEWGAFGGFLLRTWPSSSISKPDCSRCRTSACCRCPGAPPYRPRPAPAGIRGSPSRRSAALRLQLLFDQRQQLRRARSLARALIEGADDLRRLGVD